MEKSHDSHDKELVSAEECAARLGISVRLFNFLVNNGEFPLPLTIGKRLRRWRTADIMWYMHGKISSFAKPKPGAEPPDEDDE